MDHWSVSSETSGERPIGVAVINDFDLAVQGLPRMLAPWSDRIDVLGFDVRSPVRQPIDIALLDLFGQDRTVLHRVCQQLHAVGVKQVVIYTWHFSRETALAWLEADVAGVISKGLRADRLAAALLDIAGGYTVVAAPDWGLRENAPTSPPDAAEHHSDWPGREYGLTMREAEMLAMITQGLTNAEIGQRTFLSGNTVKSYIRAAYRKIGVTRRSQAVAWGMRHGMVPPTRSTPLAS